VLDANADRADVELRDVTPAAPRFFIDVARAMKFILHPRRAKKKNNQRSPSNKRTRSRDER
jgi:hypothetical protein